MIFKVKDSKKSGKKSEFKRGMHNSNHLLNYWLFDRLFLAKV